MICLDAAYYMYAAFAKHLLTELSIERTPLPLKVSEQEVSQIFRANCFDAMGHVMHKSLYTSVYALKTGLEIKYIKLRTI